MDAYTVLYDVQIFKRNRFLGKGIAYLGDDCIHFSFILSKLSVTADIAFVILIWNIFGAAWGALALALSAVTIGFFILLSIFFE